MPFPKLFGRVWSGSPEVDEGGPSVSRDYNPTMPPQPRPADNPLGESQDGVHIFLSYRRDDADLWATLLRKALDGMQHKPGPGPRLKTFLDVNNIGFGENFETEITSTLQSAACFIALIGPNWSPHRLTAEEDWVRRELTIARRQALTIIPVLVDEAAMPTKEVLPAELQWLASLNAAALRPDPYFDGDLLRLLSKGLGPAILRAQARSARQDARTAKGGGVAPIPEKSTVEPDPRAGAASPLEQTEEMPALDFTGSPDELDTIPVHPVRDEPIDGSSKVPSE